MAGTAHVLVIGPAWIGDMVMAQGLFKMLKARDPACPLDVLAPPWSLALTTRMPEVQGTIELSVTHGQLALLERIRLGRRLAQGLYRQAIILPRSFKSALPAWVARIPQRTGYRGEWRRGALNDIRPLDHDRLRSVAQRYVALGLPPNAELPAILPYPALTIDLEQQATLRSRFILTLDAPVVVLAPGAEYGPAKRWPVESFGQLARRLLQAGLSVWVLGSGKDCALAQAIVELAGTGIVNLCGRTTLLEAVDLAAMAHCMVSNDSGLMHVAAAVGTHVVALYGSTAPDYAPPLTSRRTIFYKHLACSPCRARICPLGHLNCLHDITVDEVFHACARTCEQRGRPASQ